jgi:hypothetical protein
MARPQAKAYIAPETELSEMRYVIVIRNTRRPEFAGAR